MCHNNTLIIVLKLILQMNFERKALSYNCSVTPPRFIID